MLISKIKSTINLAVPIVIGQMGVMLMGLADTIQVGQMPELAAESLGAAGTAGSLFFTIAVVGLISIGIASPLVSKSIAEKDPGEAGLILKSNIKVALFLATITFLIIFILGLNYDIFGQTEINKKLTLPYLALIDFSVFFTFLFGAFKSFTDGLKNTKVGMVITLSALILNIILNQIFIYGWGPIPAMGLTGSGISTLFCRMAMAGSIGLYIKYRKDYDLYFSKKEHRFDFDREKYLLKTGVPSGFQGFFEIAAFGSAVIMMGWISVTAQAAHMVAVNMAAITFMAATGLAAAGGINVGSGMGNKSRSEILVSGNAAILIVSALMIFTSLVMFFGRDLLVRGYTSEVAVIDIAVKLIIWGAIFQLFDGVQAVSLGLLRGMQDVNIPTIFTVIAYWGVGIPSSYYLGIKTDFGAVGIWMGLCISLIVSSILLTWRFYYQAKRVKL